MDFKNLESQETIQAGLNWIADCIQNAMLKKEDKLTFTFSPNEDNSIESIFEFILTLRENLVKYGISAWCILDNVNNIVRMKINL